MCGIAGIFHLGTPKPVDPQRIDRMCDALVHRGPDGSGVWTAPGVGLGHRRLSIIDLEGSPQPMLSTDGRAVIVFNGEIYNFRELRRELAADGARLATEGDTEVILAAWRKWGVDCLSRLDGMFAFALYDLDRSALFLARDRLGVKPLFMVELSDGSLAFASELKGLLAHPLLRRRLDPLAIEDFMAWGYVSDHRSILSGVEKLAAGHCLLLEHDRPRPQPRRWWDIDFTRRSKASEADLSAELHHHMQRAVASRMVADVPLGAFLSGGVDSSSVVALMSEASAQPVLTATIGFDVGSLDETAHARKVAELFDTDHAERRVDPDDFDSVDAMAGMFDEPFADASALPTWRVCQLARERVTVALSGDGADEAFAGYRRQVFHAREEQARAFMPAALRGPVFGALGSIWPKADRAPRWLRAKFTFQSLAEDGAAGYARALAINPSDTREGLYSEGFRARLAGYRAEQPFEALMRGAPVRDGLDAAQYADLKFWLPGDILTKVDRTSMAVSLEAREPLLDHRLIEFGATLPRRMRVRGTQGKWLLKHAMRRHLPDDILYRQKQGFVLPITHWFRDQLAGEARSLPDAGHLVADGWFDRAALRTVVEDHLAGRRDHGRLLWQLTMLDRAIARLGAEG